MDEPCKKKPRKSKLVPYTYADLPEKVQSETPPSGIQFNVNIEVEECEDWFTNLVEEEGKLNNVRYMPGRNNKKKGLTKEKNDKLKKKYMKKGKRGEKGKNDKKGGKGKKKGEQGRDDLKKKEISQVEYDALATSSTAIKTEKKDVSEDLSQDGSQVSQEDEDTMDATEVFDEKRGLEEVMQFKVRDKERPFNMFNDVKEKSEINSTKDDLPAWAREIPHEPLKPLPRRKKFKIGEVRAKCLPANLFLPFAEGFYVAIDRAADMGTDRLIHYRALMADAMLLSPFPPPKGQFFKYLCEPCEVKGTRQELENHLSMVHPIDSIFVLARPGTVTAVTPGPRTHGEMNLAMYFDPEMNNIAYYTSSYAEAMWILITKWRQRFSSTLKWRRTIEYKCFACWKLFKSYSSFLAHLESHGDQRLPLATEEHGSGYLAITAGIKPKEECDMSLFKMNEGYQCNRCDKVLDSAKLLEAHRAHPAVCPGCSERVQCEDRLQHQGFCDHFLERYYPKTCQCKMTFNSSKLLSQHQRKCPYGQNRTTIAYTCNVCKYIAPTFFILYNHQTQEHHVRSDIFAEDVKVLKCVTCNDKYSGSPELHACTQVEGKVQCEPCGLMFHSELLLKVHSKAYKDQKCNLCDHEFAYPCLQLDHNVEMHRSIYKIMCTKVPCTCGAKSEIGDPCAKCYSIPKIIKKCVYKDLESLKIKFKDDEIDKETEIKKEKEPIETSGSGLPIDPEKEEEMAAGSQIVYPNTIRVYGGAVPLKVQQIAMRRNSANTGNLPVVIKVRSLQDKPYNSIKKNNSLLKRHAIHKTVDKVDERDKIKEVDSGDKNVKEGGDKSRSLLKKIVDKIVFDDDDDKDNKDIHDKIDEPHGSIVEEDGVKVKLEAETDNKVRDDKTVVQNPNNDEKETVTREANPKTYVKLRGTKLTNLEQLAALANKKIKIIQIGKGQFKADKIRLKMHDIRKTMNNQGKPSTSKDFEEITQIRNYTTGNYAFVTRKLVPLKFSENAAKKVIHEKTTKIVDEKTTKIVDSEASTSNDSKQKDKIMYTSTSKEVKVEKEETPIKVKQEIEDTDNSQDAKISQDMELDGGKTIKQEVVDFIENLQTNQNAGCSYATEVSVSNVLNDGSNIKTELEIEDDMIKFHKDFSQSAETPSNANTVYKCAKCDYKGTDQDLKQHKNECQAKPEVSKKPTLTYKCAECHMECYDLRDYLKHLTRHGYQKFQCPSCSEIMVNNQKLAEHVLQHIKSDFRKITFIDKKDQNQTKKFRCNKCRSILSQTEFFIHWQSHFSKQPENNANQNNDELKNSTLTDTQLYNFLELIQSNDKFKHKRCNMCNREFSRTPDVKRHFIEHLLAHAYSQKIVYKELKCQICGDGFTKPDFYKKHMRDHAMLPLYQCQICDKAFSDSSNFGKHKKVHNLYVFVCDICNKKFQCKLMLEKHLQAHEDTEPMKCSSCDRIFYFESHLRKHERTHNGQTYKCTFCGYRFTALREKWVHEWEVHKERKFDADCPICNASFRNFSETRAHMIRAHAATDTKSLANEKVLLDLLKSKSDSQTKRQND